MLNVFEEALCVTEPFDDFDESAEAAERDESIEAIGAIDKLCNRGIFNSAGRGIRAGRRSFRLVGYDEIERLLDSAGDAEPCFLSGGDSADADIPVGCQMAHSAGAEVPVKRFGDDVRVSLFPTIGSLAKPGVVFSPDQCVGTVYDTMKRDDTLNEFTVVTDNVPTGFMTRPMLNELLGGRYGFCLNAKRPIGEAAFTDFLATDYRTPIDHATRLAMQRPYGRLYNPIVVSRVGEYYGVVTIKDLLDAYTKIEVEAAISANPLTKLPGNLVIEGEIMRRILGQTPYCVIYIDVDNFKAYNDAYGFENGDLVLKFAAESIKGSAGNGEFVGHIGGDDFVVICDYHDGSKVCREIIRRFEAGINSFYREIDIENGYIVSTNRHGVVDNFPIASLSIAGISNKAAGNLQISEFSNAIAQLKKKCKKHVGNYFEIV